MNVTMPEEGLRRTRESDYVRAVLSDKAARRKRGRSTRGA